MSLASAIEVPLADDRILRVRFHWTGDRFAQTIELASATETRSWLRSCEGTATDFWPESPPFQQLSIESNPQGEPVAFLVGMAGPNHWSASVTCNTSARTLEFDVACRARQRPERLGSRYTICDSLACVRIECDPPTVLDLSSVSLWATPTIPAAAAFPTTIRWRYRLLDGQNLDRP